jgi:hypothetical protein
VFVIAVKRHAAIPAASGSSRDIPGCLVSPIRLAGPVTWPTAGGSARRIRPPRKLWVAIGYQMFRVSHIFRYLFPLELGEWLMWRVGPAAARLRGCAAAW